MTATRGGFVAVTALAFGLAGCAQRNGNLTEIEGYSIPRAHVATYVSPEKGRFYLRLAPEDGLLLILDRVADRRQAEQGRTVVSGINDGLTRKVDIFRTAVGAVFCKQTPKYACGFKIESGDRNWHIVFDRQRLSEVGALKRKAAQLIQSYRRPA